MMDVICGGVAGAAGAAVGHPFDCVKVYAQRMHSPGPWAAAHGIWRTHGPMGFVRGILPPALSRGAISALTFGVYERVTASVSNNMSSKVVRDAIGGAAAGLASTVLACPMEHLKIRRQSAMAIGPITGWGETAARNTAFFGFFFPIYKCLRDAHVPAPGAWAGAAGWLASYPIDVLKTIVQSQTIAINSPISTDSIFERAKRLGVRRLFCGLTPALLRAAPVHYTTIAVYEHLRPSITQQPP
jgi:solute carrier family 25 carnitine/acylcarnitine transporter 20/29